MAQNTVTKPTLVWLRRDLRLSDNAALTAAAEQGPVIPVFVLDPLFEQLGAAAKLRLMVSLKALAQDLASKGMPLVLKRGSAQTVLRTLLKQTDARGVYWNRNYAPDWVARDCGIKSWLKDQGFAAESFAGSLLFEPWTVQTKQGGHFRVYTPYWKSVRHRDIAAPLPVPEMFAPQTLPDSDILEDWALDGDMRRGAPVVSSFLQAGEAAAQHKLQAFLASKVQGYKAERDFLDKTATSDLSDALTYGEISPAQMWHGGQRALHSGAAGAEHFLKEVVWREFAWHLMWHFPTMATANWRDTWNGFKWIEDAEHPHFVAWCQGRTGVALVDAAMRELYVTGKMHNRARMIAASYLTKHLGVHWRLGLAWFEDCLVDWDPASNAMGWQWVAGCGPDAAPYFRIFNPDTQAERFDPNRQYRNTWLGDGPTQGSDTARQFFQAVPRSWLSEFETPQTTPIVPLMDGRRRALAAYETFKTQ
ncbi:DNA photolyase PhrA [Shimia sp. NS0008-38b]|uniref:cryptochrome/photolyase family protein n=1 Tax=Shimia sp. NS0008-38b TaxID=3127653 RepID=UPI00310B7048